MQFVGAYSAVLVTSTAVLVLGKTVLETATAMTKCLETIDRYSCLFSSYSSDLLEIGVQCGSDYIQFAEITAAQCTTNEDGDFCFRVFSELSTVDAAACSSVNDSSSCTATCSGFLEAIVTTGGCCFNTVFNERISQIILGYNIQLPLNACSVAAPPSCDLAFDLTLPNNQESCTFPLFWGRVVNYLCSQAVGQPYVDNILRSPQCTPLARHFTNFCGRGPNERFCLDILQGSYPLVNPTLTAFVNPFLSEAIAQCATYSSFTSDTPCPDSCKHALHTAMKEFGCCINLFNDTVNEVLLPHFSGDMMTACGLDSPGLCSNALTLVLGLL